MAPSVAVLLPVPIAERRNQAEAYKVANAAYPHRCCVICGLHICLQVAHLDQNAGNNVADNLAHLCPTHHNMFDSGLYPVAGLRLLREHWQVTKGKLDHSGRMKDAGKKAAATRAKNATALKRSASARKAVATRRTRPASKRRLRPPLPAQPSTVRRGTWSSRPWAANPLRYGHQRRPAISSSPTTGKTAMRVLRLTLLAFALAGAGWTVHAQTAVTATCKDGSNWSGAQRAGACRGHGGVQAFGPATTTPTTRTTAAPAQAPAASVPAAPAPAPVAPAATAAARPAPVVGSTSAGAAGQVWVNTATRVYHCPGDRDYGHTKQGSYMTEAAAAAAGDRPSRGKTCS